ncbi:MAG: alpha/beta hydrolase [Bacteroidota bacterium]
MRQLFLLLCATFTLHSAYATGIDTSMYVSIGGIEQFFQVEGADATKPILLYLHGGPGQATSPKEYEILHKLSQNYVLVYWAQRNAGQTLERNKDTSTVSLTVMQQDAEEVLLFLLDYFDRKEVTLVANSWGNFLAFGLVSKYPSSIKSYVAISPNISALKSQKIALKRLRKHFNKEKNEPAIEELAQIHMPHASIEDMVLQYKWESIFNGETVTDEMIAQYMPFFESWDAQWMHLYQELYQWDGRQQLQSFPCPVYFFLGTQDYTANARLAEKYYRKIDAPSKELIWFESAHNIFASKPVLLGQKLTQCLIPAKTTD